MQNNRFPDVASTSHPSRPNSRLLSTLAGLFAALVLPFLIIIGPHLYRGASTGMAGTKAGELALWVNLLLLIAIVLFAEKRALVSIGLRRFRWWTIPLGILAGGVACCIFRLAYVVMIKFGVHPNEDALKAVVSLPITLRVFLVLRAGLVEETLFRGYPIERLTEIIGNKWFAGSITLVVFTAAHVPFWGPAQMIPTLAGSIFITLLYIWKRDLMVNVVAHSVVDGVGLLIAPFLMHRS